MKVKARENEKKKLGIKEVRVNLIKLTKEQMYAMLNTPPETIEINYNFSLKLKGNQWKCTSHPKSITPLISSGNTIHISLRKSKARIVDVSDVSNAASAQNFGNLQTKSNYSLR